ncbi:DUF3219 family protein [Terribacillus saccharophilus]|uniref:DUF3219 family protein n=1 Tax=Terribacillus saccharophilus TaxID=361277 RepID=UPI002989A0C1|nr:DUF3219 family protein [Terribacillus saccharophilus]MEC0283968.1 DUF3219 family protein [Terribacillus saccharophilus]MEC0289861.1 DUF3219 family protein [Terribacillus saccharophilus]
MNKKVVVNGMDLAAYDYEHKYVTKNGKELNEISFKFPVTSEDYHDVAVLLYKDDFRVEVPEENIAFEAAIKQYSTSITNLYEKDQVGEYSLVLEEKAGAAL